VTAHSNIDFASATDVGVRRSHNQDSFAALPAADPEQWRQRGHVFLVADGMGAHAVGELASKLAADSIPHIYSKYAHDGPAAALRKAFVETNLTIHTRGQQNREFEGMGTTGTALVLRPEGAWLGHVGDSRAYRVRGHHIEQLTFDHSLVWELARRQKVSPDELQGIPSNVIVRSLGPEPLVQIDIEGPHAAQAGDIFVLCSDGLSGQVADREIGAVVSTMPPAEACRLLVDLANLQGGPDNITVLVVHILGESASTTAPVRRRRPLGERLPGQLSFLLLLSGILLAMFAMALTYYQLSGGLPVFILAALALVGGLVGLLIQSRHDERKRALDADRPRIQVYRAADCSIGPALLQKVAKSASVLEARLREHNWDAEWHSYRGHLEEAEACARRDELPAAFRAYCRALRLLADAFHRQRSKEEVFQPVWDKAPR
jgi:protein phosphatase